jgi:hypothetical protein
MPGTGIAATGLKTCTLTVDPGETATTLKVTATSVQDTSMTGTATVTVQ